jgi:alkanesulfonate monooxygenase SsuD/methylene tetrahydromethanopterin reductase-like flavin-dependent oxidoreductase (luciferase family)
MQAGVLLVFSGAWHEDVSDAELVAQELRLGVMAEELGFDSIWSVEHHFTDYSMCPDNFVALSNIAARTSTIKVGTGAAILPWNDPLRVAEKASLLDNISGGRLLFGMGRGLARIEYESFGIAMDSARERFDEAAVLVTEALETGVMKGDGEFYAQAEATIRPRPLRTFKGRTYSVGQSLASTEIAADLGAGLLCFVQTPMEKLAPLVEAYRERFRSKHDAEPPPPLLAQEIFCHEDEEQAKEMADKYIGNWFFANVRHYDMFGTHWPDIKGYESYAQGAAAAQEAGIESVKRGFIDAQCWGTPEQIIEQLHETKKTLGDFGSLSITSYGGLPYDIAETSYRLYAREVLPVLKKL